jgi:hypothetical protein
MRQLSTLLLLLFCASATAQFNVSVGYSGSVPLEEMAKRINMLHSISASGSYTVPKIGERLQVGIDLSLGTYAQSTKEQTFRFGNGTTTVTDVQYSSNVFQGNVHAKLQAFRSAVINPYISGKVGYASFYSNVYIEDPHDETGCRALDQSNIITDGTLIKGYGGGLMFDFTLFSKYSRKGRNFIDFSVSRNSGGKVNYINTKKLYDAAAPASITSGSKPLNVRFVNASTQQIHEHQVAEVFTTPVDFLELKLSAFIRLGKDGKSSRGCKATKRCNKKSE